MLGDPLASTESELRRLDPRVKLLAAAAFSVAVAVLNQPLAAAVALAVALRLLAETGGSPSRIARRLLVANAFIGAVWLVLPWSTPGRPIASVGPIALTDAGLRRAALMTLKCNAVLAATMALLATSPLAELARALRWLRTPDRLVMVFVMCARYVSLIHREYVRLTQAMKMRGFVPKTNLRTYRTYANLVGALVVRVHGRARRIYDAMLCRGFRGAFPVLCPPAFGGRDAAAAAGLFAVTALLPVLEWILTAP